MRRARVQQLLREPREARDQQFARDVVADDDGSGHRGIVERGAALEAQEAASVANADLDDPSGFLLRLRIVRVAAVELEFLRRKPERMHVRAADSLGRPLAFEPDDRDAVVPQFLGIVPVPLAAIVEGPPFGLLFAPMVFEKVAGEPERPRVVGLRLRLVGIEVRRNGRRKPLLELLVRVDAVLLVLLRCDTGIERDLQAERGRGIVASLEQPLQQVGGGDAVLLVVALDVGQDSIALEYDATIAARAPLLELHDRFVAGRDRRLRAATEERFELLEAVAGLPDHDALPNDTI